MRKGVHITASIAALLIIFATPVSASTKFTLDKDDLLVIGVNTAFQCIAGGVGSLYRNNGFIDGLKKGCLGGALIGGGKYITGKDLDFSLVGKLAVAAGTSVVENAIEGRRAFEYLGVDFGPAYFSFGFSPGAEKLFYRRPLQLHMLNTMSLLMLAPRFEGIFLKETFLSGTLIIKGTHASYGSEVCGGPSGFVICNSTGDTVLRHELIHTYQKAPLGPAAMAMINEPLADYLGRYERLRWHEYIGTAVFLLPEFLIVPNYQMYSEYEAEALTDYYYPGRPHSNGFDMLLGI